MGACRSGRRNGKTGCWSFACTREKARHDVMVIFIEWLWNGVWKGAKKGEKKCAEWVGPTQKCPPGKVTKTTKEDPSETMDHTSESFKKGAERMLLKGYTAILKARPKGKKGLFCVSPL